eukprot:gene39983-54060_t
MAGHCQSGRRAACQPAPVVRRTHLRRACPTENTPSKFFVFTRGSVRSKKMAAARDPHRSPDNWTSRPENDASLPLSRRTLLAGTGAAMITQLLPASGIAQRRPTLTLQARPGAAEFRAGTPGPIWLLQPADSGALRYRRGDELDVTLENQLPVPVVLNWHGIDGAAAAQPLLGRPPLAPGSKETFRLPLRHAGTFMTDIRLLGDTQARPSA